MLKMARRLLDWIVINNNDYRFLFRNQDVDDVISLDCETTGFDPRLNEIVSIAAIPIRGSRILTSQAFRALIRPEGSMNAESIRVHQLREKDVESGRAMREILPELLHFIGGRPLVGYWIDFDVRMLDKYLFGMLNIHLPNRRIDVSNLYYDRKYRTAPPGTRLDLSFAAICRDLGLPMLPQHDAFNDALVAAEMYVTLTDMAARGARIRRASNDDAPMTFAPG